MCVPVAYPIVRPLSGLLMHPHRQRTPNACQTCDTHTHTQTHTHTHTPMHTHTRIHTRTSALLSLLCRSEALTQVPQVLRARACAPVCVSMCVRVCFYLCPLIIGRLSNDLRTTLTADTGSARLHWSRLATAAARGALALISSCMTHTNAHTPTHTHTHTHN